EESRPHLDGVIGLRPERLVFAGDQRRITEDHIDDSLLWIALLNQRGAGRATQRIRQPLAGNRQVHYEQIRRKGSGRRTLQRGWQVDWQVGESGSVADSRSLDERLRKRCLHLTRHLRAEAFVLIHVAELEIRHSGGQSLSYNDELGSVEFVLCRGGAT